MGLPCLLTELSNKAYEGLPALGLVLDVLDKDALEFYRRFDFFHAFTSDPMRLFVPMTALRKI